MSDFQDAFNEGKAQTRAVIPAALLGALTVIVNDGSEEIVSLEKFLDRPSQKRGTVTFHDETSFSAYVLAHQDGRSRVFADVGGQKLVAVLDHHSSEGPGWGRHRAILATKQSKPWLAWMGINKNAQWQVAFAEFIENNLRDIAAPAGAEILRMVNTFQAKRSVTFDQAQNLTNGSVQLAYHDAVTATGAGGDKGMVEIPKEFILALYPFETGQANVTKFQVTARLRYRLGDGAVKLWVDLLNPEDVIETAFLDRVQAIEKATGTPVWRGDAPPETTAV